MKLEQGKTNAFRSFIGIFTRNWGLKLLSLVLAIVIYHSLKTNGKSTDTPNERPFFRY